jgi:hypothetical protein
MQRTGHAATSQFRPNESRRKQGVTEVRSLVANTDTPTGACQMSVYEYADAECRGSRQTGCALVRSFWKGFAVGHAQALQRFEISGSECSGRQRARREAPPKPLR